MCVDWLVLMSNYIHCRDDTVRFTDLNTLKELAVVKLEEQPMILRTAGSTSLVVCGQ